MHTYRHGFDRRVGRRIRERQGTMFAQRIVVASAILVLFAASSALADFKRGNVFVSDPSIKFCMNGDQFGWDRIWEIDPDTGVVTLFAELANEQCGYLTGLAFTPDGTRLRASSLLTESILEFASDGTFTVVLDAGDGIGFPEGSNNIAYDAEGNFYVVNTFPLNIMRFPAAGGPGEVVVDNADGVAGSGKIAFALGGDLYSMNTSIGQYALRITPQGGVTLFDEYKSIPTAVSADDEGHLFVGLGNGTVYRYNAGDPNSREVLVSGPPFFIDYAMTMSEDESRIYVAALNQLVAVDPVGGAVTLLAVIENGSYAVGGIAVAPGPPMGIPAVGQWGMLIMMLLIATAGTTAYIQGTRGAIGVTS